MSELQTLHVESLEYPHEDLPDGMKMFAQLIIEDYIWLQTLAVDSQSDGRSWKLRPECSIFRITLLRQSEMGGTRLLGYTEIQRDRILELETSKIVIHGYNPDFVCQLRTVNTDGPAQRLTATFATSWSLSHNIPPIYDMLDSKNSLQIWLMHERVLLAGQDSEVRAQLMSVLGNISLEKYKASNFIQDLSQAICAHADAVRDKFSHNGENTLLEHFQRLGTSLLHRYVQLGDLGDLNQAITHLEASVELLPDDHPDKPSWLHNLGVSLRSRFDHVGDFADLNKAFTHSTAAVDLTPEGHPNKPTYLNGLGSTVGYRFECSGDIDDLNRAITYLEAAVELTPNGHLDTPIQLKNLGIFLLNRFAQVGDLVDLNQGITHLEAAVHHTPAGHRDKPSRLGILGSALVQRFKRLGDLDDLNRSITSYCQKLLHSYSLAACSPSGTALARSHAAGIWAKFTHSFQPSPELKAYATAIDLLPELAWPALSISDRHHHLLKILTVRTLARDAAAAAIAAGNLQKAVEWLEQGRTIIWGQFLGLRTPVDDLNQSHPRLAEQFITLSRTLEMAGTRKSSIIDSPTPHQATVMPKDFHEIALQRNHVLDQIRKLPGFEQFLLPKSISQLSHAAKSGPVVILNISEYRCDGLILLPDLKEEVIHAEELAGLLKSTLGTTGRIERLLEETVDVPPGNSILSDVKEFNELLKFIQGTTGRVDRLQGCREGNLTPDQSFSHILSELWIKIVQPILKAIAINSPTHDPGHIWWCPTGPLAFLPIHAAGLYDEDKSFGSKLSDFVISSYTPSLSALIEGHRQRLESQPELQLLALSQPSATGQSHIPGTQEEVKYIQEQAIGKLDVLCLDEQSATPDNVRKAMRDCRWVHFACHGVQHPTPTESALLLAGSSRLTLSDIIQLELPNADLAFLSACETATGSSKLQDEAVHLTAGMLLAGYRSVIGTMWTIQDNDAPQVARDVYAHLLQTSPPDPRQSAKALHIAVQNLQKQGKSFLHWVPFVHFGV
ncbi:CHAT domain-containing protein [Favolaschia claudopus]|uniref:CHAT domain-containing protein n=1 Tax=Favolaschia claudopus TaxID=2862362 RepID=A0AAV9ZBW1_9AGAR